MYPDIMKKVTGKEFDHTPAILEDYACLEIRDQVFPGVIQKDGMRTYGQLVSGISLHDMNMLDRYESDIYKCNRVYVVDEKNTRHAAWCYVVKDKYSKLLGQHEWDRQRFEHKHKQDYLNDIRGQK